MCQPTCRRSSRQPPLVVQQVAVLRGSERLLEVPRAVLPDCHEAIRETDTLLAAHTLETLTNGLRDRRATAPADSDGATPGHIDIERGEGA